MSCRELLVFVGKNEAGKSAVFRGLSKLNPSDGEKYDGLKEFPRRRYTDEFKHQDWPAAVGLGPLALGPLRAHRARPSLHPHCCPLSVLP